MPLVEPLVGYDTGQGQTDPGPPRRSAFGRAILWAWLPMMVGLLIYALGLITSGSLSVVEIIGLTMSFGLISGGLSIIFAHELMHSTSKAERAIAELLMAMVPPLWFRFMNPEVEAWREKRAAETAA